MRLFAIKKKKIERQPYFFSFDFPFFQSGPAQKLSTTLPPCLSLYPLTQSHCPGSGRGAAGGRGETGVREEVLRFLLLLHFLLVLCGQMRQNLRLRTVY